jgi:hypothetical protein
LFLFLNKQFDNIGLGSEVKKIKMTKGPEQVVQNPLNRLFDEDLVTPIFSSKMVGIDL